MAAFVLAHLSDPHLATMPRPRAAELASKRAIGYYNWRQRRHAIHRIETLDRLVNDLKAAAPDHIAVTGDLVNIALADEFAPARAWLDSLGSVKDVSLVPGNHDTYVRRTMGLSRLHWTDFMSDDADDTGHFPFVRLRGPVAVIGLSSAVPSAPLMATGVVGPQQLKKLATILAEQRDAGRFRVVLIHHPPRKGHVAFHKRLIDSRAVRDVLLRQGAELVLHGHDHIHSLEWLDGPDKALPLVGVPSASAAASSHGDPAAYNLYQIDGERNAWRCEVVTRGFVTGGETIAEINRTVLVPPN